MSGEEGEEIENKEEGEGVEGEEEACVCEEGDEECECPEEEEVEEEGGVSMLPHILIGVVSILGAAWSFLSMSINDSYTFCGFSLSTWFCASYVSTWLAYWIVSLVEMIFWILSWVGPGLFVTYVYVACYLGFWGSLIILMIPVLLQVLSAAIDKVPFSGKFLTTFIINVAMWLASFLIHLFFLDGLVAYAMATYGGEEECVCEAQGEEEEDADFEARCAEECPAKCELEQEEDEKDEDFEKRCEESLAKDCVCSEKEPECEEDDEDCEEEEEDEETKSARCLVECPPPAVKKELEGEEEEEGDDWE